MRGYPSRWCFKSSRTKTRDFAATSKAIQACGSQDRSINWSIRCDGTTDRVIEASDDDGHNDGDIHLSDVGGESDRGESDDGSQSDYEEDLLEEEEWLGIVQWGELLSQHLVIQEVSFTQLSLGSLYP